MAELLRAATEWLAATGAPNWLLLLALLTRPIVWAKKANGRISGVLDMLLPGNSDEQ